MSESTKTVLVDLEAIEGAILVLATVISGAPCSHRVEEIEPGFFTALACPPRQSFERGEGLTRKHALCSLLSILLSEPLCPSPESISMAVSLYGTEGIETA